jgi:hypothetical protein
MKRRMSQVKKALAPKDSRRPPHPRGEERPVTRERLQEVGSPRLTGAGEGSRNKPLPESPNSALDDAGPEGACPNARESKLSLLPRLNTSARKNTASSEETPLSDAQLEMLSRRRRSESSSKYGVGESRPPTAQIVDDEIITPPGQKYSQGNTPLTQSPLRSHPPDIPTRSAARAEQVSANSSKSKQILESQPMQSSGSQNRYAEFTEKELEKYNICRETYANLCVLVDTTRRIMRLAARDVKGKPLFRDGNLIRSMHDAHNEAIKAQHAIRESSLSRRFWEVGNDIAECAETDAIVAGGRPKAIGDRVQKWQQLEEEAKEVGNAAKLA